jgi:hypothetical protein
MNAPLRGEPESANEPAPEIVIKTNNEGTGGLVTLDQFLELAEQGYLSAQFSLDLLYCSSSNKLGLLSLGFIGGSGSPWVDVRPLGYQAPAEFLATAAPALRTLAVPAPVLSASMENSSS